MSVWCKFCNDKGCLVCPPLPEPIFVVHGETMEEDMALLAEAMHADVLQEEYDKGVVYGVTPEERILQRVLDAAEKQQEREE